jgi:hypothetical protein
VYLVPENQPVPADPWGDSNQGLRWHQCPLLYIATPVSSIQIALSASRIPNKKEAVKEKSLEKCQPFHMIEKKKKVNIRAKIRAILKSLNINNWEVDKCKRNCFLVC